MDYFLKNTVQLGPEVLKVYHLRQFKGWRWDIIVITPPGKVPNCIWISELSAVHSLDHSSEHCPEHNCNPGSWLDCIRKHIIKTSMRDWMREWADGRNQIWSELSCESSNFPPQASSTETIVSWITILSGVETEFAIVCFQEKVTFEKPSLKRSSFTPRRPAWQWKKRNGWDLMGKSIWVQRDGGVCRDVPLWCGKVALEKSGCVWYRLPVILYLLPSLCYSVHHRGHKREGINWGKS